MRHYRWEGRRREIVHCDGQGEVMKQRNSGVRGLKGYQKQQDDKEKKFCESKA